MISFYRNPPNNPEEWFRLLQVQEQLHSKEMKTWQKVIQSSIDLLRKVDKLTKFTKDFAKLEKIFQYFMIFFPFQTEQSLSELQNMILTHRAKNSAEKIASVAELFTSPDEIS